MLSKKTKMKIQNDKGMAIIEMIPIIIVIVLLMNYAIGFWGAIHSGVLNSIAARNYAFETFRHKSNLVYFRGENAKNFFKVGQRVHTIAIENDSSDLTVATARNIDFLKMRSIASAEIQGSEGQHDQEPSKVVEGKRFEGQGVNPIWIKSAYGICLNAACLAEGEQDEIK